MNIYYYIPENQKPSWGLGMLCYHVFLLNEANFQAFAITEDPEFKPGWLDVSFPICTLNDAKSRMTNHDFLIVPEFFADKKELHKLNIRKAVFVQNAYYIHDGLTRNFNYERLGYEAVFYYMPHLKRILENFTILPLYETPPFIAPYFFKNELTELRKNRILVYPKFSSRDFTILMRLLKERLKTKLKTRNLIKNFTKPWEIIELKEMTHREVARQMQKALFFICLNTTEAFNSAIPEAMAAGCISLCYDGYGSADFLIDKKNAFVFPNNYVFELADKIVDLVLNLEEREVQLSTMRKNGFETANYYKIGNLRNALVKFFTMKSERD